MIGTIGWQRIEGLLIFASGLALYLAMNGELPWWVAILVFFAPDLSFFAYVFGPKIGAFGYNAVHIYGFGASVFTFGLCLDISVATSLGAIWLAHAGFDRLLGYGLKTNEGFKITHMGEIGQ